MRIIAGEARGRRIFAPEGAETRPTSDRTREALFNIIAARVPGARVLDLFGGTGALALEAMSRGADYCVINDVSPAALKVIKRNIGCVLKAAERAKTICLDYRRALSSLAGNKFDIVFLDPPYALDAYTQSIAQIMQLKLLAEDGLIIAERDKITKYEVCPGLKISDTRVYRDTALDFISAEE